MTSHDKITLSSEDLAVQIMARGAALVGVHLEGGTRNLVLGFANPGDPAGAAVFAGPLVGPIANRVRRGVAAFGGKIFQMPLNEANQTCLHSGRDGLHARDWQVLDQTADRLKLSVVLRNGDNGLPGRREITATYHVDQNTLRLTITATTDQTTPMNIAAHPYWNLDGCPDVSTHRLLLNTQHYLPTDALNLPTGEIANVGGSIFDFSTPRPVPLDPALDVNFCLTRTMQISPQPAATLIGSDGTTLNIATTSPGIQVYNGAHLPSDGPETAGGPPLAPYAGIALEPQHWPDALHHQHFPPILLKPNETYRQITEYTLSHETIGIKIPQF